MTSTSHAGPAVTSARVAQADPLRDRLHPAGPADPRLMCFAGPGIERHPEPGTRRPATPAHISEQAALKVLYLAVRNLEEFRSPNTGIRSSGWKQALQAFTIYFDERIPTP